MYCQLGLISVCPDRFRTPVELQCQFQFRYRSSKHLRICSLWSPAPALVVPCTPMLVVCSVIECLVDHVLHWTPSGSEREAVAS